MDEFIERKALITKFKKMKLGEHGLVERLFADGVYAVIAAFPAADVAPVVHGLWEREPASYWRWTPSGAVAVTRTTYRCGLCGRGTAVKSNYCPNCGAKMDGGAE